MACKMKVARESCNSLMGLCTKAKVLGNEVLNIKRIKLVRTVKYWTGEKVIQAFNSFRRKNFVKQFHSSK